MFDKLVKFVIIIGAILGTAAFILHFTSAKKCCKDSYKESLNRHEHIDLTSQTPSVSLIITAYPPHFKYLGGLIKNIENGIVQPDEIIISASETSEAKLSQFIQKNKLNIRIIPTELKQNASQNRNRAIKVANSDYIMIADGDDLVHNRKLEICVKIFKQNPNIQLLLHNYDIFSTDWESDKKLIFNENDSKSQIKQIHEKEPNHTNLIGEFPLHHAHVMFKRSIWPTIQYNEDVRYARREDGKFCQDILDKLGNVYAIDLPLIGFLIEMTKITGATKYIPTLSRIIPIPYPNISSSVSTST